MPRYVCIHGHFYQPPRENPWLEAVELQESAAPWHDWNARIAAECYNRNAASRILDARGDIVKICNNYSRISFNVGPTLLSWLEEREPHCYRAILEADILGRKRFSGHGPAMAQVYSHSIMPLANRRDKATQVRWGLEDFKRRFGRDPEGMWLAEAAVDTETLEVLAENGILFTVLAPKQAAAVRPLRESTWHDVRGERVDTRRAYRCDLPSGRSIALFFYDGRLAQEIAFGGLLHNGEHLAHRLIGTCTDPQQPELSHVATDGESYGHHHDHGDMALAYCLETLDRSHDAQLTVYGEFLALFPPEHAVRIVENSSWSCAHGVERWRGDCGCNAGTPGFHQRWRGPLREALDALRDDLAGVFERESAGLFPDPWGARDAYISVVLDRSPENVGRWLAKHASRPPSPEERRRALSLMEMQRSALLMYTSCGWFFDDISRIETVQILRYAARAIELGKALSGRDPTPDFLSTLERAPSNVPELENGARVYELLARPGRIDKAQLAAHYGITSLFPGFGTESSEGCWRFSGTASVRKDAPGSLAFSAGTVRVRSVVTEEEGTFLFAANYRGGTSMLCGVSPESGLREPTDEEASSLHALFAGPGERELVDRFGHALFSLRHILRDAQHRLLDQLLQQDVERIEESVRSIVRSYDTLLDDLTALEVRPPRIIASAAEVALTANIVHALEREAPDLQDIRRQLRLAARWRIAPDAARVSFALSRWLHLEMEKLCENPRDVERIDGICGLLALFIDEHQWRLSLYQAQNLYYETLKRHRTSLDPRARDALHRLGRRLRFSETMLRL
ncbi:MAG: DUF3536 domain-containing protein [Fretibacterium sp.]|nr:DUF3536 domain-containing protein [Fretibacterium sp.]